jgi:hypothetical protein
MALTFTQQPSGILGANSPLIYQAYDSTNYASAGFEYEFEVYVWSGTNTIPASPLWTLRKLPDVFAGSRAYIDIHRLVSEYIAINYLAYGTATPNIGSGAYWVAVKIRGYNNAGGGTPVSGPTTSNIILCTRGYSYSINGINSAISNAVLSDRTTIILTTESSIDYLWYNKDLVSSINVGSATITPSAGSTSSLKIQGFELKQALTSGGVWGANSDITFNLVAGGTYKIAVEFDCPSRYGSYSMLFLNRYGVYEGMTFNAIYQPSWSISRENYQTALLTGSNLNTAWSYGMRQTNVYNLQSKKSMVINTDWIPEAYVEYLSQMVMSESVVFRDGANYYAVNVLDSQMEQKRATNIKLIQYAFNLEFSQPYINKIVR